MRGIAVLGAMLALSSLVLSAAGLSTPVTDGGVVMPTSPSTATRVSIRIENGSAFDFDDVLVFFPDQPQQAVHYGAIEPGAMSDYHPTTRAYRYAHVEVQAGDRHFVLRPTDYVGEEALPAGRFTYVLSIDGDSLRLSLRQDA